MLNPENLNYKKCPTRDQSASKILLFQHIPKKGKGRLAGWREIEALEVSKMCVNFAKSHVQYDAWSDATFKTQRMNAIH